MKKIWDEFFQKYCRDMAKKKLEYTMVSEDDTSIKFTLRMKGRHCDVREYNVLFIYMMKHWKNRAGIDNMPYSTGAGISITADLGDGPYFYKENDGVFKYQITEPEQVP